MEAKLFLNQREEDFSGNHCMFVNTLVKVCEPHGKKFVDATAKVPQRRKLILERK